MLVNVCIDNGCGGWASECMTWPSGVAAQWCRGRYFAGLACCLVLPGMLVSSMSCLCQTYIVSLISSLEPKQLSRFVAFRAVDAFAGLREHKVVNLLAALHTAKTVGMICFVAYTFLINWMSLGSASFFFKLFNFTCHDSFVFDRLWTCMTTIRTIFADGASVSQQQQIAVAFNQFLTFRTTEAIQSC